MKLLTKRILQGYGLDLKPGSAITDISFHVVECISVIGITAYWIVPALEGNLLAISFLLVTCVVVYLFGRLKARAAINALIHYTYTGVLINLALIDLALRHTPLYVVILLPAMIAGLYLSWRKGLITLGIQVLAMLVLMNLQGELLETITAYMFFTLAASVFLLLPLFIKATVLAEMIIIVRQRYADLTLAYTQTVESLSIALDLRDHETRAHSDRVTYLTIEVAKSLGITNPRELRYIEWGARLHDIGKIGVPDAILRKPGKLDAEEWHVMKQHPSIAVKLLQNIKHLAPALTIPQYHHERWDGSGYVEGLKGEEIPLWARIFMVVDVYDALSESRVYRSRAYTDDEILQYLRDESGVLFDPVCVEALITVIQTRPLTPLRYQENHQDPASSPHQDSAS